MSGIKEATFRHQFLTTDKVEVLLAQLHNLKALNLSQNKINILPRGLPSTLIALDLSYNLFATFPSSDKLHNLIELKLSNNSIESTAGLAAAVSLQFLDLSHNRIKTISGIESMKNLKSLQLEGNLIASPSALRSLSFNRNLSDLVLEGNPLALLKNYKIIVLGFVLSLKKLDGERVKSHVVTESVGYADGYSKRRHTSDMRDFDSFIAKSNSSIDGHPRPLSKPYGTDHSDATSEAADSIYIDGWSTSSAYGDTESSVPTRGRSRSPVPWRNPPSLPPKDRKGNSIFGATGDCTDGSSNISRRFSSADSSPIRGRAHFTVPTGKGFYGSPGKGTTKSVEEKKMADILQNEEQCTGQEWATPLLAKNARLKRIQSEERILRKLSAPPGGPTPAITPTATAAKIMVKTMLNDSCVRSLLNKEEQAERGRSLEREERGRSRERQTTGRIYAPGRSRSPSRSPSPSPPKRAPSPSKSILHSDDHVYVKEREASYLNKHLGISTAEELWHEELIEEAMSLSMKSPGRRSNNSSPSRRSSGSTNGALETVALSPALQNKSSVLRAVCTAEAIRKRNRLEKDEQMRRRSPSPVRAHLIDWEHHTSGGKTPPYHRSSFFKITHSESEKNAEIESERDYKSVLSRGSNSSPHELEDDEHDEAVNMKKKELKKRSPDLFDRSFMARHDASMNAEHMAPVVYGNYTNKIPASTSPSTAYLQATYSASPPQLSRPISPVHKRTPSPPRLHPHHPVQIRPQSPKPPSGRAQSPPKLRPTSPTRSRSASPPRVRSQYPSYGSPQSTPPHPKGHPLSPPQLRPASPLRSTSPPRQHHLSPSLNRPQSPYRGGRASSPVEARSRSPPPQMRCQSPIINNRSESFDSLDHTDVGNHSRSPTQNRVPVLNKSLTSRSLRSRSRSPGGFSSHSQCTSRVDDSDLSTRSISPRFTEPVQMRRKQIYESALLLNENNQTDDFFGDFKYLERLLTEAGDGSIEVRRLKTVMRTIMESRKESLQLLQSAISTPTSSSA